MNILLVDDSAVMRALIRKTIMLCRLDIGDVYEASNGKEGLAVLAQSPVDLLFLDVNMPVMDGLEMLEEIRSRPETGDLPVLMVSTESHKDRITQISEMRADFVHKPFTPEVLRKKILEILAA